MTMTMTMMRDEILRTSIAGAAEAVPPRGQDAPVHDLAGHLLPSFPVQGGHPSVSLQVGLIKC